MQIIALRELPPGSARVVSVVLASHPDGPRVVADGDGDTAAVRTTVRMLFKYAVKLELVEANPFADVAAKSTLPTERKAHISAAGTEKLLAVSSPTWRIIIALARYAGVRCPSEALSLKWSDVNFE